ncbi:Uncharacterised protein [Vibrio cholerae]|uniref:Uncharacterized protein n=1 Tax=Vibrio cholerae TaxID=666 RepID=A0A655WN93_VIBCL|nr:hypothetical protein VAA049_1825 [Vibrio cholerae]GHW80960.1 hypothetical protein VCSRO154_1415 [Vibrio metoecus]AWB71904.1 hypothetical protein Sa5Y_VCA02799 [Vibrio cholerae]KFD95619.1 hypothetical protein DN33_1265 [Vibrio cholerae]KFE06580.1 hypothetical protein DN35_806 [Vibrio cholerae]
MHTVTIDEVEEIFQPFDRENGSLFMLIFLIQAFS